MPNTARDTEPLIYTESYPFGVSDDYALTIGESEPEPDLRGD